MIKHNPRLSRQVMAKSMSKTSGKSKKDLKLLRDECDRLHKRNTELRVRLAEKYPLTEHIKEITLFKEPLKLSLSVQGGCMGPFDKQ